MDLPDTIRFLWRNICQMRFQSRSELWIERCDQIVIILLLPRGRECIPWQIVEVPGVNEVYIRESKRDCAFGFRECCDEEVGTERDRSRNGRLYVVSNVWEEKGL